MGEDRRAAARDLEEVRGVDWSRSTWSEPSADGSLVVVRQSLTAQGDQEVVWRVPTERLAELSAALGITEPAADADEILGWVEGEPDRLELLVLSLEAMHPPVVEDLYLS